ncbi:MAG: DNA methyltransferase [Acidobacteriota bacterium]
MQGQSKEAAVIQDDDKLLAALAEVSAARVRGQQIEAAWFHPFPARMPTSIAQHLIERLTDSSALVFDPMCGSGTTLVAAGRSGRSALGCDWDPLAVLLTKAVIQSYAPLEGDKLRVRLKAAARQLASSGRISVSGCLQALPEEDRRFIEYWFPPESQRELFALALAIQNEPEESERILAWSVLSSLVISKVPGASYAIEISRSRPRKCAQRDVVFPLQAWDKRFRRLISRTPFAASRPTGQLEIYPGDARQLALADETVDFVLTSPPYITGVDYFRSHKFALIWMGHRLATVRELRGCAIGSERGLWSPNGLPEGIEARISGTSMPPRRVAVVRRYLSDLQRVLLELSRVLRKGGVAILFLGPRLVSRHHNDVFDVVAQIAGSTDLRPVGGFYRKLNSKRRSLPLPARASPLAKRLRREAMVALRKG